MSRTLRQCGRFLAGLKDVKGDALRQQTPPAAPLSWRVPAGRDIARHRLRPERAALRPGAAGGEHHGTRRQQLHLFHLHLANLEVYRRQPHQPGLAALSHTPGSLYRRRWPAFARWRAEPPEMLESRPIPAATFEFMFYFDFEGSVVDQDVKTLLSELNRAGGSQFLGNYSEV